MFYSIVDHTVHSTPQPPAGMRPIAAVAGQLLPPAITDLHHGLRAWGEIGLSPGVISPERVWCSADGRLAFDFAPKAAPSPVAHVGLAQELAAWLVMLDKWMETFVVIARARAVWSADELAGALSFATPAFLPRALVYMPPDTWERVATALAIAVDDGDLAGGADHRNMHWR